MDLFPLHNVQVDVVFNLISQTTFMTYDPCFMIRGGCKVFFWLFFFFFFSMSLQWGMVGSDYGCSILIGTLLRNGETHLQEWDKSEVGQGGDILSFLTRSLAITDEREIEGQ